jgi:hypothetical protein
MSINNGDGFTTPVEVLQRGSTGSAPSKGRFTSWQRFIFTTTSSLPSWTWSAQTTALIWMSKTPCFFFWIEAFHPSITESLHGGQFNARRLSYFRMLIKVLRSHVSAYPNAFCYFTAIVYDL